MTAKGNRKPKPRWSTGVPTRRLIATWIDETVGSTGPHLSDETLDDLVDLLRKALNRANNAEAARLGIKPPGGERDLIPGQVLEEKTNAIIRAVEDYVDTFGEILRTPSGEDIFLDGLRPYLKMISSMRSAPKTIGKPGRPSVPWNAAGREFALAIQAALKGAGFRRSCSLKNPNSAPVIIATRAIKWAYRCRITEDAFVSATRGRDRALPRAAPRFQF